MRSEHEIRSALDGLERVIALPGDGGLGEGLLKTHALVLRWVMGEDNLAGKAFDDIRRELAALN